eukprot:g6325.t1 g6325   contig23:202595-203493(+)
MKILGICGGIGSGKSTACQLMVDSLGCVARIDADLLAHGVYEPGSQSLKDIVAEFGSDILIDSSNVDSSEIDRKKLGAIVFSDSKAMSKLEQIVWPHVRAKLEDRIEEVTTEYKQSATTSTNEVIIVEAALLLETSWHDLLDGLWVIQSSQPVAVQRLKDNRGLTEEEALVRIRAQEKRRGIGGGDASDDGEMSSGLSEEIEKGMVTAVITNDGSLDDLKRELHKALTDSTSFKNL